MVKADVQDKRILIHVSGPTAEDRRGLLAIIRSDFEHIHQSYKFHPQEMIPLPENPDVLVPYQDLIVIERCGLKKIRQSSNGRIKLKKNHRGSMPQRFLRLKRLLEGIRRPIWH